MGLSLPAATLVAGAGSAVSNLASTFISNEANKDIAEDHNDTSIQIARENNELQREMVEKNNQFSHDEAELAYQRELEKMEMMNQYNSPIEQLKRYQEAGINPNVGFAGHLATAASDTSAPVAQPSGSGITPSMPSLVTPQIMPFNFVDGMMNGLLKYAQIKNMISMSGKNDAETKQINETLSAMLDNLRETTRGQKIANDLQNIYGSAMFDANLSKIIQETATSAQQASSLAADGNYKEALEELARAQVQTERTTNQLRGEERDLMKKKNETFYQSLRAEINKMQSEAESNRASAEVSREEANRIRELLPDELRQVKNNADLAKMEVRSAAMDLVQAWEDYNNTRLTPEQRQLLRDKVTAQLLRDAEFSKKDVFNPAYWIAKRIHPIAQEIGIAFGGNVSGHVQESKPAPKRVVGFK